MKEIEILGDNRFETFSKTRAGSRAVIVRDGKILLSHETGSGWWLVPGGGVEGDETPEECCVREAEEEKREKEKNIQKAMVLIKSRYGKNAILKGMNFEEGGTAIERNGQVGGHRA